MKKEKNYTKRLKAVNSLVFDIAFCPDAFVPYMNQYFVNQALKYKVKIINYKAKD